MFKIFYNEIFNILIQYLVFLNSVIKYYFKIRKLMHPETITFWFEAANGCKLSSNRLTSRILLNIITLFCAYRPHILYYIIVKFHFLNSTKLFTEIP